MELAIRAELRVQGYRSQQSKIRSFRLAAIERPGWVSVYEFHVEAFDASQAAVALYGVARDDGRRKTTVQLYESVEQRDHQRDAWAEGLILAPYLRR